MDDIVTPRLSLRLLHHAARAAILAGNASEAGRLIDATVPEEVLDRLTSFRFDELRESEDPLYRPWATRAIILRDEQLAIGHIRFHSRPGTAELQAYGPDAVELGYRVFQPYRRNGYATEALTALMDWATSNHGVRRFVASVSPDNLPALRLVSRLGFIEVGEAEDEADGLENVFLRSVSPT